MKKKLSSWFVMVALVAMTVAALAPAAYAAAEDPVGTAAIFDIGMGARALGMGGAFVAVVDDGNAIYYNPAGLAGVEGHKVSSLYSSLHGAGSYIGVGYAQENLGVGIIGLMSTVTEKDEYGNPGDDFGYREGAVMGGYARKFGMFSIGGSLKLYSQAIPDNNGFGVTGDIGALIEMPWIEGFKLGVVARNLVGTAKYGSGHTDKFDPVFVAGASMKPIPKMTVAADFDITSTKGHVGVEYQVIPALAVRAGGAFAEDGDMRFSAGAGFSIQNFTIDYAYQMHTALPDSHWLSLGVSF